MPNYFTNLFKYQYDPTGTAATNLIVNEPHVRDVPSIEPIILGEGSFYIDGLVITSVATGLPLDPETDYSFEAFNEELSMVGKEVASAIVLTDLNFTGTLEITYQCVGGPQGKGNSVIEDLIAAIEAAQSGSVNWLQIVNPLSRFPPELHTHILSELTELELLSQSFQDLTNSVINTKPLLKSGQNFQEQIDGLVKVQAQMQNLINKIAIMSGSTAVIQALENKVDSLFKLSNATINAVPGVWETVAEVPMADGTSLRGSFSIYDGADSWQMDVLVNWTETKPPVVSFAGFVGTDENVPEVQAFINVSAVAVQIKTATAATVKVRWQHLL